MRAVLDKYEATGQYEAPEYQEVMYKGVYGRHLCRLDPWPDPVARSFKHLNTQVYGTMQGPNEFVVTGTFKDWDRWKDLSKIKVPTLVMGAKYDTMDPEDIRKMGRLIPSSRVAICENGSHLAMWDDQEAYFRHLLAFLRDVQEGRMGPAKASPGRVLEVSEAFLGQIHGAGVFVLRGEGRGDRISRRPNRSQATSAGLRTNRTRSFRPRRCPVEPPIGDGKERRMKKGDLKVQAIGLAVAGVLAGSRLLVGTPERRFQGRGQEELRRRREEGQGQGRVRFERLQGPELLQRQGRL